MPRLGGSLAFPMQSSTGGCDGAQVQAVVAGLGLPPRLRLGGAMSSLPGVQRRTGRTGEHETAGSDVVRQLQMLALHPWTLMARRGRGTLIRTRSSADIPPARVRESRRVETLGTLARFAFLRPR